MKNPVKGDVVKMLFNDGLEDFFEEDSIVKILDVKKKGETAVILGYEIPELMEDNYFLQIKGMESVSVVRNSFKFPI